MRIALVINGGQKKLPTLHYFGGFSRVGKSFFAHHRNYLMVGILILVG